MKKEMLIQEIKKQAKKTAKLRRDPRFKKTMAFLIAKGFLFSNQTFPHMPNARIKIEDALWAGKNIEPRILEVLPAAVLRFGKNFYFDKNVHKELDLSVTQLRTRQTKGDDFCGIPFEKYRVWIDLPLKDKRTKKFTEKKLTRTFRLKPETEKKLKQLAHIQKCSEAAILEKLVAGVGFEPTTFGL